MILVALILTPLAGGILAALAARRNPRAARWICLLACGAELGLALSVWAASGVTPEYTGGGRWIQQFTCPWIPQIGASIHLAIDGLSLLMILLTALLGILSVAVSWTEIRTGVGFFHLNLMWVLAGVAGVFLAMDLFLFYFFWELMLVPMYFLIDLWGHENRHYAAVKFFLFTQLSGLLMLLAILGLYFAHGHRTGVYTFDYEKLLGTQLPPGSALVLMSGFLAAFLVKLPAVPLHTWLPDAHTEAPTAGSVILAGLLLKTGAYGLIRFAVPLFPMAAAWIRPSALIVGAVGIIYGAVLAFGQRDFKRMVAYTSVSHLGFVLLGVFSWNDLALQGAVMQMLCHGLSTPALFIVGGMLQERLGTRDMTRMGGLWASAPKMGAAAMFFAMASLGLPGLGNFIGEFLVLLGTFHVSIALAAVATVGLVAATVYSLWMIQQTFHGRAQGTLRPADLRRREQAVLLVLAGALVWLGVYPQPVLDTFAPAMDGLYRAAQTQAPPPAVSTSAAANTGANTVPRLAERELQKAADVWATACRLALLDRGPDRKQRQTASRDEGFRRLFILFLGRSFGGAP